MARGNFMNVFMKTAIDIAMKNLHSGNGGPFGAVVVKEREIVGLGVNEVTSKMDPTAHAEIQAIRQACIKLNDFSLAGAEIYTSCEPCPMCLGAIFWSRIDKIYFGATKEDAALISFDDHNFYEELKKPMGDRSIPMEKIMRNDCIKLFDAWSKKNDRVHY